VLELEHIRLNFKIMHYCLKTRMNLLIKDDSDEEAKSGWNNNDNSNNKWSKFARLEMIITLMMKMRQQKFLMTKENIRRSFLN